MKNRKKILSTLVISATLLSPTVTTVFADTIQSQTTQEATQNEVTPKEKIEKAIELGDFKAEDVRDMDGAETARYFGDKNTPGKEININNQKFVMVTVDENSQMSQTVLENGKTVIEEIKATEQTYKFDSFVAYYKDGVFVMALDFSGNEAKAKANTQIIKDVFVKILDGKSLAETTETTETTETKETEKENTKQETTTTTNQQANNPKELVELFVKHSTVSDVTDITDATKLKELKLTSGKEFIFEGTKFAIGIYDPNASDESTRDMMNNLALESETTYDFGTVPAYYYNGVFIRCTEPRFANGAVNQTFKDAKNLMPKIAEIINELSSQSMKEETHSTITTTTTDSSSGGVDLGGLSTGFDDDSSAFGDDTFGTDNPQTFDSSIATYIGAMGASIAGIIASVGVRKRK